MDRSATSFTGSTGGCEEKKKRTAVTSTKTAACTTNDDDRAAAQRDDPSPTNEQILRLVFGSYLEPKDVGRCSQVCRVWQKEINHYNQGHTWKQAAQNISSKLAVHALEAAMMQPDDGCTSNKRQKTIRYQDLARGFQNIVTQRDRERPPLPKPSLKPEDLFLLLQVSAFGTNQVLCKSMAECCDELANTRFPRVCFRDELASDYDKDSPTIFCMPSESRKSWNLNQDGHELLNNMRLTMSLWRRDTGQSLCICADQESEDDEALDESVALVTRDELAGTARMFFFGDVQRPSLDTPMGETVGMWCMRRKGINYLLPDIHVCVTPMVPSSKESGEESQWRCALIEEEKLDFDQWKEDDAFLAHQKELFQYFVNGISVNFRFSRGEDTLANGSVKSTKDFLIFLEGLSWK